MSFIFWSDVTFIYQIGNYLVGTYLFPRFYVRHSVCTEYGLYYKYGVLIYKLGAPYCTIPCNILPTWKKRARLYKPDSLYVCYASLERSFSIQKSPIKLGLRLFIPTTCFALAVNFISERFSSGSNSHRIQVFLFLFSLPAKLV